MITLLVRFPCLNYRTRNRLAFRSEHASLDIHILSLSFRRDRLSKRDCMRHGRGGCERRGLIRPTIRVGNMRHLEKRTIWRVLCEERSQDRALRRVSKWGIVECIYEG